jgi:hypothetical protein
MLFNLLDRVSTRIRALDPRLDAALTRALSWEPTSRFSTRRSERCSLPDPTGGGHGRGRQPPPARSRPLLPA